MSSLLFNNAMCWAQIRLSGGWKRIGTTTGIIAAMAAAGAMLSIYYSKVIGAGGGPPIGSGSLLGIQVLLIVFFGSMRVGRAIRHDLNAKMLESHRLMPMSSGQAILGYIVGANMRLICLFGVIFLVGTGYYIGVSLPLSHWFLCHLILACFAAALWAFCALSAFTIRGLLMVGLVILFSNCTTNGILVTWLPGLMLLLTPLHGETIFTISRFGLQLSNHLVIAMAIQGAICLLCLNGAARKYDRPDSLALPISSMLGLLALWVFASVYGAFNYHEFTPKLFSRLSTNPGAFASVIAALLVALGAVASTAWSHVMRAYGSASAPTRPMPAAVIILLCLIMISPLLCVVPNFLHRDDAVLALCLCGLALGDAYLLMRIAFAFVPKPAILVSISLALVWLGPLLAEAIYSVVILPNTRTHLGAIAMASPLAGIWSVYWHSDRPNWLNELFRGLIWQIAALAILFVGYLRIRRRRPKFG